MSKIEWKKDSDLNVWRFSEGGNISIMAEIVAYLPADSDINKCSRVWAFHVQWTSNCWPQNEAAVYASGRRTTYEEAINGAECAILNFRRCSDIFTNVARSVAEDDPRVDELKAILMPIFGLVEPEPLSDKDRESIVKGIIAFEHEMIENREHLEVLLDRGIICHDTYTDKLQKCFHVFLGRVSEKYGIFLEHIYGFGTYNGKNTT